LAGVIPDWELILRLLFAAGLGGAIGINRERLQWSAGLRTHVLVSAYGFAGVLGPHVILDPSRIAAQVVSGVGFLGAGSIILRNEVVKGLTPAANLWAVAAMGHAVGGGLYVGASAATVIILIILAGVKPLDARIRNGRHSLELRLQTERGATSIGVLQEARGWRAVHVKQMFVQASDEAGRGDVTLPFGAMASKDIADIVQNLAKPPTVSNVRQSQP